MVVLNISKKAFEVILVFGGALMLFAFESSVLDVSAAMLAPIFGLVKMGQSGQVNGCSGRRGS